MPSVVRYADVALVATILLAVVPWPVMGIILIAMAWWTAVCAVAWLGVMGCMLLTMRAAKNTP